MRDPARIERVISSWFEIGNACAVNGLDLFDLALRELFSLLDKDYVIFEREVLIDIFLVLKVADLDRAVIREINNRSRWPVRHPGQYLRTKLLHRLFGRTCFLTKKQYTQSVELLTVIYCYLAEAAVGLATAAGTAVGDVFNFIDSISKTRVAMKLKLLRLGHVAGEQKAFQAVFRYAAILRRLDQR